MFVLYVHVEAFTRLPGIQLSELDPMQSSLRRQTIAAAISCE